MNASALFSAEKNRICGPFPFGGTPGEAAPQNKRTLQALLVQSVDQVFNKHNGVSRCLTVSEGELLQWRAFIIVDTIG
jgi:hypothetical protein